MTENLSGSPKKRGKIQKLPDEVVNLIAAGEVIQRPANVVKELIENCIDAGSTQISVSVKHGGLKQLQIQDNGSGISFADLPILCERFTTSKLKEFSDLQSIGTYGFRGEALASISHVARLAVTTKTDDSACGYRAEYADGKLFGDPRPCAGNRGTIITVEDLFYKMNLRRNALKSHSEEYSRISDVVFQYAVHNSQVGFSLKRQGEASTSADVKTAPNCTSRQVIGVTYGAKFADELIPINLEDANLGYKLTGLVTNPNFSIKKAQFILFINHRLVECLPMRKAMELLYVNFVPKHSHPFVYISLEIPPENIDVNVHPTKQEVKFLNETPIIERLTELIENELLTFHQSRAFTVNTIGLSLPPKDFASVFSQNKGSSQAECDMKNENDAEENQENPGGGSSSQPASQKKPYDHKLVRTDNREQKLDMFLQSTFEQQSDKRRLLNFGLENRASTSKDAVESEERENRKVVTLAAQFGFKGVGHNMACGGNHCGIKGKTGSETEDVQEVYANDTIQKEQKNYDYESLNNLRKAVIDNASKFLRQVMRDHTFVGCVDPQYALVQHDTGLYMADTELLSEELFYQVILYRFGNFGSIQLTESGDLTELMTFSGFYDNADPFSLEKAKDHADVLDSKSQLLREYFSLGIENKRLIYLPEIISDYTPQCEGVPNFLWKLGKETDWGNEQKCFHQIAKQLAKFYAFKKRYCNENDSTGLEAGKQTWKLTVENILYPAFKSKLFPPNEFSKNRAVLKLTDLQDLYKVFERC